MPSSWESGRILGKNIKAGGNNEVNDFPRQVKEETEEDERNKNKEDASNSNESFCKFVGQTC